MDVCGVTVTVVLAWTLSGDGVYRVSVIITLMATASCGCVWCDCDSSAGVDC